MAQKKTTDLEITKRMNMLSSQDSTFSLRRQCRILGIPRSRYYYKYADESEENKLFMILIDELFTRYPFYGVRRITRNLQEVGHAIGPKRVRRLMGLTGLAPIYPKKNLSLRALEHKVYPYLLRDVPILYADQVWSTDITYIRLTKGFCYLVVILDWYSRKVLSWRLSNTLESAFCLETLEEAHKKHGVPKIFNTDQGSQFTSNEFTDQLKKMGCEISMDGRGRALDNVFIERLWWTVKFEDVYPRDYADGRTLYHGLEKYFLYYNEERKHSALGKSTPAEVFWG